MNLYRIWQDVNDNYDTYDSAVVAAETVEAARLLHPAGYSVFLPDPTTWANPENVQAELIGIAVEGTKAGVICASFNAG